MDVNFETFSLTLRDVGFVKLFDCAYNMNVWLNFCSSLQSHSVTCYIALNLYSSTNISANSTHNLILDILNLVRIELAIRLLGKVWMKNISLFSYWPIKRNLENSLRTTHSIILFESWHLNFFEKYLDGWKDHEDRGSEWVGIVLTTSHLVLLSSNWFFVLEKGNTNIILNWHRLESLEM